MAKHASAVLKGLVVIGLLGGSVSAGAAPLAGEAALEQIQFYGRYPDERPYYPDERYNPPPRRGDDAYPREPYVESEFPRWRPGDIVPPRALDFVVDDWEERGLERPPGGHQWFRVRGQFILVREEDRMISRVITFD